MVHDDVKYESEHWQMAGRSTLAKIILVLYLISKTFDKLHLFSRLTEFV